MMNRLICSIPLHVLVRRSAGLMAIIVAVSLLAHDARQRIGIALMQFTIPISAWPLGIFYRIHADGNRILMCGKNILPDQPEASAHVALVMLVLYAITMFSRKSRVGRRVAGFWVALGCVCLANALRIFVLAAGTAFPNLVGHVDVSSPFWHTMIDGLCVLLAGVMPFLFWAFRVQPMSRVKQSGLNIDASVAVPESSHWSIRPRRTMWGRVKIWLACFPVACAMALVASQPHLSFAGESVLPAPFSVILNARLLHPVPLTAQEQMALNGFGTRTLRLNAGYHRFLSVQADVRPACFSPTTQRNFHVRRYKSKKRYC